MNKIICFIFFLLNFISTILFAQNKEESRSYFDQGVKWHYIENGEKFFINSYPSSKIQLYYFDTLSSNKGKIDKNHNLYKLKTMILENQVDLEKFSLNIVILNVKMKLLNNESNKYDGTSCKVVSKLVYNDYEFGLIPTNILIDTSNINYKKFILDRLSEKEKSNFNNFPVGQKHSITQYKLIADFNLFIKIISKDSIGFNNINSQNKIKQKIIFYYSVIDFDNIKTDNSLKSYCFGIKYNKYINNSFNIGIGLNYSKLSFQNYLETDSTSFETTDKDSQKYNRITIGKNINETISIESINIPVYVSFKLLKNQNLAIDVGLNISFLSGYYSPSGVFTYKGQYYKGTEYETILDASYQGMDKYGFYSNYPIVKNNITLPIKRFIISPFISTSYSIALSEDINFSIGLEYLIGITNVLKSHENIISKDINNYNSLLLRNNDFYLNRFSVNLGIGYSF